VELRQYLALARKWAWLLILATVLATAASYYYSRTLAPSYRAETLLLVGQLQQNADPAVSQLQTSSNLAAAYSLLVTQPPILQATADAVHFPGGWQALYFQVSATASGGQLIRIAATDSDPHQSKVIADELARQLILQSPISSQQKQAEQQSAFVTSQQEILRTQIEAAQKTLSDLNNQAAIENDTQKLQDLNARISALQTKVDNWQKNYASLSALLNSGSNNFLTILSPAQEPTSPVSPNVPRNILFGAVAGLVLAGCIIFLLEYLDDTIKAPDDAQRILNLPTLGAITRISGIHKPADHLITLLHPRSPIAEAYRVLRTNLRFSGIENPTGAVLVTSGGPAEGKTTTAANLAITMAQSGKRVVLVDTDLRRPSIHKFFDLPNNVGLSSLFLGDAQSLDQVIQPTAIEGLRVLTSGQVPPNPAEVLESKQMNEILSRLRAQSDMVILDSPPVLAVADASILGSRCSGAVLVVDAGHTRSELSRRAVETLGQTKVKVLGVVLNKLSSRRASGYYYYYYYSSSNGKSKSDGRKGPS
jgi:non-specific protein-tyrosine kinase